MKSKLHLFSKAMLSLMIAATIFASALNASASPARRGNVTVTQADGTTLTIRLHGDEHFNYRSTVDGYPIVEKDGFYYYASYESPSNIEITDVRVNAIRTTEEKQILSSLKAPDMSVFRANSPINAQRAQYTSSTIQKATSLSSFPNEGVIKSVIILAEFSDVKFSISDPQQAFENQLNEEGYSVSGATGSAKDYYYASSKGKFIGDFDVYGPYTLSNSMSYYGGNQSGYDIRPQQMIEDAVELADADGVDFTQYDVDGDGVIDNVFVYYAGYCEAQGGSSSSIWSHKWEVYGSPTFDGKILKGYACTAELRGSMGTTIAGIGTFCHEFGHVFGLYDHYDTTGYTNGYSYGTGSYDIMDYGNYNNDGNTPPIFNAFEMQLIGWIEPTEFSGSSDITLEPLQNGVSYMVPTEEDGEYFLIEARTTDYVWDAYIPGGGLFITHIDMSSDVTSYWNNNAPNGNSSHECFKFVVAGNRTISSDSDLDYVPYPSNDNVWSKYSNTAWSETSSPKAQSWDGVSLPYNLYNIAFADDNSGAMTFTAQSTSEEESVIKLELDTTYDFIPVVGVKYRMGYTITSDNTSYTDVVWSSSDESIMTIDANGEYIFLADEIATITATIANYSSVSASVTLNPTIKRGITGRVTDSQGAVLTGATIELYSVSETSMSVEGAQQSVSTRAATPTYSMTTDEYGDYLYLLLSTGRYELIATYNGFVSNSQFVVIVSGMNQFDITLTDYLENSCDIAVGQREATLSWSPQGYDSFAVEYTDENGDKYIEGSDEPSFTIVNLLPQSTYDFTVSGVSSDKSTTVLYGDSFTTLGEITSIPMVLLSGYEQTVGDRITLRALNINDSDEVEWYYNGYTVSSGVLTVVKGEKTVICVVTRGSEEYTIRRVICGVE
ncbi:MAG: M6 family metalloprotease domain-containing protein [Rikenellaceae bacterium]